MPVLGALLLLTIAAGLWRIWHGPTPGDRLLAIQMFGTTGTALLLVMAEWLDQPALLHVALLLALLAAVVSAALVQYLRREESRKNTSAENKND